jgi:hypothetical protein
MRRIEGTDPVEVYISQKGYVCIKQESMMGQEDSIVMMLPIHVPLVVKWLQEAAAQVEGEPVGIIEVEE